MCDKNNVILERFQELIRDSGKTRQVIAQDIGCDTSTVTKQFNGDMKISVDYLVKYARYFGVSTDYLLGLQKEPTSNKDISFICEYTGLSQNAIKSLHLENEVSSKRDIDKELLHYIDYLILCNISDDFGSEYYYLLDYLRVMENVQGIEQKIAVIEDIDKEHDTIIALAYDHKKQLEKLDFLEYKFIVNSKTKLEEYIHWRNNCDMEKLKQNEMQARKTIEEITERYWHEYVQLFRRKLEEGDPNVNH